MKTKKARVGRPKLKKKVWASRVAFGKEVKKRLIDRGISQYELASQLGISSQNMNNILQGIKPGKKHIQKIAEILHIDLNKYAA